MFHKLWLVIFFVILIDIIAFSIILPVFPALLDSYRIKETKGNAAIYLYLSRHVNNFCSILNIPESKKYTNVLFGGLLGSLFSILQFISSPLFGVLSDIYGRKPLLLLSMVGISLSYVIWAKADTFMIFLISRIVGGFCKANISMIIAIATDITEHKDRSRIMAIIGAAFSLGFIIGPTIGGIMAHRYHTQYKLLGDIHKCYTILANISLSLSIINIITVWSFLPETHKNAVYSINREKSIKADGQKHSNGSQSKNLKCSPFMDYINPVSLFSFKPFFCQSAQDKKKLKILGMIYFLYLFLFSGLEFTLAFFTHQRYNFDSLDQGKMFCFIGIVMVIIQGGCLRRLSLNKEKYIALGALLLLIPANILIALSHSKLTFYSGLFLHSLSTSMAVPCLSALVSYYDTPEQRGILMGIHRSLGSLARALGPLFASIVFWSIGPTFCYILGACLQIIPATMLYLLYYTKYLL